MIQVRIKRVYEDFSEADGYRVLVDKLWPRGMKREWLKYDYWAKDITPSASLRKWFHEDIPGHWNDFVMQYQKELAASPAMADFLILIRPHPVVTLLYASKEPVYNHARILRDYLEMHLKEETEEVSINSRELITVIIITAAVFAVSNISYLDQSTLFSSRFAGEMFTIRTLVDLSGLAVLYAYHIQVRELQMKFEVDTLQNILEMQYKNYQLSQESIEIVNQKYHDLKHQITLLKAEANSEKSTQYLEQMEKEIKSYEAQNKTGNKVLDAVLTSKSLYCQNKGIGFTCVADGTLLNFMAEMDISALFGNILDNAIEGAEKIPEKEKRLIHLSVAEQKSFLRIRVENYCEEKIVFKNGIPQTTKKDKRFHGFGMKSIQSTVKKYGGSVTAGVRDNWFELRILIPLHVV